MCQGFRYNFLELDFMKKYLDDVMMIPMNECPEHFHEIKLLGWNDKVIILDETDNTLKEIIDLSGFLLKGYIDFYKDKFEFSHPAFVYIPEKGFSIKIGIREKKIRKQVDNV